MKRLDQIESRANAATEGPWYSPDDPDDFPQVLGPLKYEGHLLTQGWIAYDVTERPDAEFIAHARTDVPRLVGALRAVLELHVRAECPTCGSRDGEGNEFHKCDDDAYCEECDLEGYPCPTVAAIQKYLGETETL